jgi:CotH kinase protein/Secretion system C-terminal sorting domain
MRYIGSKKTLFVNFIFLFFSTMGFGQTLVSSNLPILIIETNGQSIPDQEKVLVKFKVIYGGEGKVNLLADSLNAHYNAYAGVELRGSSSQMFPKKPYGVELRHKDGSENPQPLLGLPAESDWVLFASYNEKSLMHNVLTLSLGRQLGGYASRSRYVELMLNGEYQGVYVLLEKIKRDKNRLDIANLKPEDIEGDQLTGGYILKIDKGTGSNLGSFTSKFANLNANYTTYYYDTPKSINSIQKKYISEYVAKFEQAIYGPDFKDPLKGYQPYIDVASFVKMFILNEVSRNIDGYRISSFLYKDRDSKGGKLSAGPPWDYDITYGNADYCDGKRYDLFAYNFNSICPQDFWLVPGYWQRLLTDPYFVGQLRTLYFEQRKVGGSLDINRLNAEIDSYANTLQEAQKRNFQKWPILGIYIWPNSRPVPATWEGEVLELKTWLANRLLWLDANLPKEYTITANELPTEEFSVKAFPNPFIDKIQLTIFSSSAKGAVVGVYDESGRQLLSQKIDLLAGQNEKEINLQNFETYQKIYFLKIQTDKGQVKLSRMVKVQ